MKDNEDLTNDDRPYGKIEQIKHHLLEYWPMYAAVA